ncbi:TetR/AcrR family transcriptional regulator [Pantoea ananatis]|jgi:AcrR family transcriptional regulator|uniref:TetR/AcrR family transcriptional regulator n=1 Tax=Pantoea ananas TaxID=553 RepID=UPI0006A112B7|nr:TetR/AcrR family transcriptional regulator [Pantoea ananatis]KNA26256.1 TetR-family transcriptional regulator [Pantoea ananatis]KNA26498.1 TetR-family transcriptional regulator [Pantoea ananatis]MDJ0031650.1 TetR/AcrR family transcriptional regulator [Pantoea ananatis]MDJ0046588.1 TetR/AcrR family transcriptional regulator [Pantoea ananatis]SFY02348.1 transcriptional regulator, TetR family [Pantoea ananatis]
MKASTATSGETRKETIIAGAIALFIEKGIEKTTTRDLTESLGISRSHIYHYFPDWHTLTLTALEHFMQRELDDFTLELAALDPVQQLHSMIEGHIPDTSDSVWRLYASFWQMASHNADYAELADKIIAGWDALLCQIIRAGVEQGCLHTDDVARSARQLNALLNGYADLLSITSSPARIEQALADIHHFVQFMR